MAFLNLLDLLINSDLGSLRKRSPVLALDSSQTSLPSPAATLFADGLSLSIGDRVILSNLSSPTQKNKIYKVVDVPGPNPASRLLSLAVEHDGISTDGSAAVGDLVQVLEGTSATQLWCWDGAEWARVDFNNLAPATGVCVDILLTTNGGHAHSAMLTLEQIQSLTEGEVSSVTVLSTIDAAHQHSITVTWDGLNFQGTIANNHSHTFQNPVNGTRLPELGSTPATPPTGYSVLYFKTDHKLYRLDSTGTETLIG